MMMNQALMLKNTTLISSDYRSLWSGSLTANFVMKGQQLASILGESGKTPIENDEDNEHVPLLKHVVWMR